jgi:histidinol phosphatase-like PHP family hydrolase
MININIEFNKFVTDERFVSLISNDKQRNIMYKILENPLLLENLLAYKYQNEVDIIKGMNFNISDDKIKEYLNKNNGNIELVVGSILNL